MSTGRPDACERSRVGVVVVNFGSHALLERNLGSVDLGSIDAHAVVVDNFRSDADTAAMVALAEDRGWRVETISGNVGFGAGVNAGADAAISDRCDVLIVANPDLAVTTEVVARLADAVRADPKVMISPRVVRPNGDVWFAGGHVSIDEGRVRSVPAPDGERTPGWLSGACLAIHRDLWNTVSGFDDTYFLYWEDVDLSYRVRRAGGRLEVRGDLFAVHDVGGTQHAAGQRAKSSAYYYYNCRNRLLFAARHLSRRDRLRWAVRTPADLRRVLLRGGRRQLLNPGVSIVPAIRGALAGLAEIWANW
jgi:N-acetylglucosaminyl-diphospho-decaprenol L-rhamnosyltransferase